MRLFLQKTTKTMSNLFNGEEKKIISLEPSILSQKIAPNTVQTLIMLMFILSILKIGLVILVTFLSQIPFIVFELC